MRKTIVMVMVTMLFRTVSAQLNPVSNLQWDHWYICPNNYFVLSWDAPAPSDDSLAGYNIYRETDLYRFDTVQALFNTGYNSNCGEDFVFYEDGGPFWMHVTALYNKDFLESAYIDSAYCFGFAIGINDPDVSNAVAFPNPTTGKLNFNRELNIQQVTVLDQAGKVVNQLKQVSELDLSSLPNGEYYLKIYTDKGEKTQAIIVE